jgi:hypothetical protein
MMFVSYFGSSGDFRSLQNWTMRWPLPGLRPLRRRAPCGCGCGPDCCRARRAPGSCRAVPSHYIRRTGAGELGVRQAAAAHVGPQVEAGVGQFDVHHLLQQRRDGLNFSRYRRGSPARGSSSFQAAIEAACTGGDIAPPCRCGTAGISSGRRRRRRRSPSACPARSSASTGWRTRPGWRRALAGAAAQLVRRFQRAQRRRGAEIDLGIALVGGDHEAVAVGQREQLRASRPASARRRSDCPGSTGTAAARAPRPSPARWRSRSAKLRAGSELTKYGSAPAR